MEVVLRGVGGLVEVLVDLVEEGVEGVVLHEVFNIILFSMIETT